MINKIVVLHVFLQSKKNTGPYIAEADISKGVSRPRPKLRLHDVLLFFHPEVRIAVNRCNTLLIVLRESSHVKCIWTIKKLPKFMKRRLRHLELVQEVGKRLIADGGCHAKWAENSIERFSQVNKDNSCAITTSMRVSEMRSDLMKAICDRQSTFAAHLLSLKKLLEDVRLAGANRSMDRFTDLTRDQKRPERFAEMLGPASLVRLDEDSAFV